MKTKTSQYADTLEHFLDASEEDFVDVNGILQQFPRYAPAFFEQEPLKRLCSVLDIGSGNGKKGIFMAKKLSQMGREVTIDSLEPKPEQIERLLQNYQRENQCYLGEIYQTTLEDFIAEKKYNLALLIHCLYEFPTDSNHLIYSLQKIPDLLTPQGIGIIVIEAPQGDFQQLKREIYPYLGKSKLISLPAILETLHHFKIDYQIGSLIDFNFSLNDMIQEPPVVIGKNLDFLFSTSLEGSSLQAKDYFQIGQWVKNHVHYNSNGAYLWTPDITVWIQG